MIERPLRLVILFLAPCLLVAAIGAASWAMSQPDRPTAGEPWGIEVVDECLVKIRLELRRGETPGRPAYEVAATSGELHAIHRIAYDVREHGSGAPPREGTLAEAAHAGRGDAARYTDAGDAPGYVDVGDLLEIRSDAGGSVELHTLEGTYVGGSELCL